MRHGGGPAVIDETLTDCCTITGRRSLSTLVQGDLDGSKVGPEEVKPWSASIAHAASTISFV